MHVTAVRAAWLKRGDGTHPDDDKSVRFPHGTHNLDQRGVLHRTRDRNLVYCPPVGAGVRLEDLQRSRKGYKG